MCYLFEEARGTNYDGFVVPTGRIHCAAVQRVPVDHYHRRRLFYTNPVRAGVDSYEPFQGTGVFLLAGRTLRVFCPAQVQ